MNRSLTAILIVSIGWPAQAQTLWQFDSAKAEPRTSALLSMGEGFATAAAEPAFEIPAGELVSLKQVGILHPARPTGPQLMLQNGDCWPGTLAGGKGLALEWNASLGQAGATKLSAALPAVRAIWFVPIPHPDDDAANFRWVDPARKQDTLLMGNGDVQKGTLVEIAADGQSIRFKQSGESDAKTIRCDQLASIAFDPSLARNRIPKGAYAKAVLRNGARITLAGIGTDGKAWQCKAATGGEFPVPFTKLVSLDVMQGKATYLADLTPKAAKVEPFNTLVWNWQANRSVKGKPLWLATALGEECFDRGLGTHSKTTLEYDLAGKYRFFEALVGLDARTGNRGNAAVEISVDGKLQSLPGLANLKPGPAVPVRIDVSKARTLQLRIDFGTDGDVQDDVNWGNARLID
jgi:hypothetical protein